MKIGMGLGLNFLTSALVPSFNPLSISGCSLWLRADLGVSLTGGVVSSWADQTTNANNYGQSTAGFRPTVATAIGGQSTINFLASGTQWLLGPSFSALTAADVFIVLKYSTTALSRFCRFGSYGDADYWPFVDGHGYLSIGSTVRQDVGLLNPIATSGQLLEVISTSSEFSAFQNGIQRFTTATNTVGWEPSGSLIGASTSTGIVPGSLVWNGDIAEWIIYDHKLSTPDRTALKSYLASRYGLTIA